MKWFLFIIRISRLCICAIAFNIVMELQHFSFISAHCAYEMKLFPPLNMVFLTILFLCFFLKTQMLHIKTNNRRNEKKKTTSRNISAALLNNNKHRTVIM